MGGREVTNLDDDALVLDDPLRVYLRELHRIPPLSRDEEIDCVHHVRAGDQLAESAGKRLAEANLLLVVSIAERYRNDHIHILNLIQEGNDGLLRAVQTFSDSRRDSFSAHATDYIERAIAEAIAGWDSATF
jgi:RNA polymerase primary sigma factor